MSSGISIEHRAAHVHIQNDLAESFIKRLQLIARLLLVGAKLSTSTWGHAIFHAVSLNQLIPNTHQYN